MRTGLLSFFDLSSDVAPGSGELQYRLVLHGNCSLARTCMTACIAVPEPMPEPPPAPGSAVQPPAGASGGASASSRAQSGADSEAGAVGATQQQPPVLIVGCDDGIHAYSVTVDDAGLAGGRAVLSAVQALSESLPTVCVDEPRPPSSAQPSSSSAAASSSGIGASSSAAAMDIDAASQGQSQGDDSFGRMAAESRRLAAALGRDWRNRVHLTLVSSCKAAHKGEPGPHWLKGDVLGSYFQHATAHMPLPHTAHRKTVVRRSSFQLIVQLADLLALRALQFAGCIIGLNAVGGHILATEFLGSVTSARLFATKHGLLLAKLSADDHDVFTPACAAMDGCVPRWLHVDSIARLYARVPIKCAVAHADPHIHGEKLVKRP